MGGTAAKRAGGQRLVTSSRTKMARVELTVTGNCAHSEQTKSRRMSIVFVGGPCRTSAGHKLRFKSIYDMLMICHVLEFLIDDVTQRRFLVTWSTFSIVYRPRRKIQSDFWPLPKISSPLPQNASPELEAGFQPTERGCAITSLEKNTVPYPHPFVVEISLQRLKTSHCGILLIASGGVAGFCEPSPAASPLPDRGASASRFSFLPLSDVNPVH